MSAESEWKIRETGASLRTLDSMRAGGYLSERSPMPLIAVEGSTHVVHYVNPAFCRLAETTSEDLIGKPFVLAVPESEENGCLALLESIARLGGAESLADQKHRHATSEPSYWSYTIWAVLDSQERPSGAIIQVTDTTQQTLARQHLSLFSQTLLRSGLRQHELTEAAETGLLRLQRSMRETDHRAKNNLQIIVALLDMQITEETAEISVAVLLQLRLHIQTVASFHDLLNHFGKEDPRASAISAPAILQKLLPMWQQIVGIQEFRWSSDAVELPIAQGMSLALLINELLTNAVKHGGKQVELQLALHGNSVTLIVSDDGAGFAPEFDPVASAHFGLEFVESVVRLELRGTTTYTNGPEGGACVTIVFSPSTVSDDAHPSVPVSSLFEPSLLQATLRSFTLLANTMQDHAILLLDEWSNIVKWSLGAERMFGYSAEEMLGESLSRLYTSEEVTSGQVTREIQQATREGSTADDRWMRRKDGSRFFASSILTALTATNVRGFLKILRDTTDQKEGREYEERRQIQIAVLRERDRLAHELHATLHQDLEGIARQLEAAQDALSAVPDADDPVRGFVMRALTLAHQGLAEGKQAAQNVRSPLLQNADLAMALRRLVAELTTSVAAQVEVRVRGLSRPASVGVEDGLLRVGQEALLNALQHAEASFIRITLAFRPDEIELLVEDNGQGFDSLAVPENKSLGLHGMQHRMQRIGGSLVVVSSRSAGTKITALIPG